MTIELMLAEHPHVTPQTDNISLGHAVHQAMLCAAICNSCADASVAEPMDMRQCIRLCLDCADVCTAAYRIASRRSGGDRQLIRTMLAACVEVSDRCAEECEFHGAEHSHCRRCAAACRDCADACRAALVVLNQEAHHDAHHIAH
jgi:Domain of Unknown Function (DUF326)